MKIVLDIVPEILWNFWKNYSISPQRKYFLTSLTIFKEHTFVIFSSFNFFHNFVQKCFWEYFNQLFVAKAYKNNPNHMVFDVAFFHVLRFRNFCNVYFLNEIVGRQQMIVSLGFGWFSFYHVSWSHLNAYSIFSLSLWRVSCAFLIYEALYSLLFVSVTLTSELCFFNLRSSLLTSFCLCYFDEWAVLLFFLSLIAERKRDYVSLRGVKPYGLLTEECFFFFNTTYPYFISWIGFVYSCILIMYLLVVPTWVGLVCFFGFYAHIDLCSFF